MPNQQSFLESLWKNDPWMLLILIICWVAMFSSVRWIMRRFVKPPVYPTPRVMYIIPPIGALIAALLGWYYHPANGYLISLAGFGGLMLGLLVSLFVHLPKASLWGAGVGLVFGTVYSLATILIEIKNGQDPWSDQAWNDRLTIVFLIVIVSISFFVNSKMRRLAEEQQPSDPPTNLRASA